MATFESLFGIKKGEVKKVCLLLPIFNRHLIGLLADNDIKRGKLFRTVNTTEMTVVHTGIGAPFVGDAVLYLKDTPCEAIILFGSCGLVKKGENLDVGSLVLPECSYGIESFSDFLYFDKIFTKDYYPDKFFIEKFYSFPSTDPITKVNCATVSSLKLEEDRFDEFLKNNIDIVDMECSAFFSAASFIRVKALALFYISDIIKELPFYNKVSQENNNNISEAERSAIDLIKGFIDNCQVL